MLLKSKKVLLLILMLLILIRSDDIYAVTGGAETQSPKLSIIQTTNTQIRIKWATSRNFLKYGIYRASENSSDFSLVSTSFAPTFTDTGLKPSETYRYFVRAYTSKYTYIDSAPISASTEGAKLVLGFTTRYSSADTLSYNSLIRNSSSIDEIATYTYIVDGQGNMSVAGSIPADQISFASNNGIKTYALITNEFNGRVGKELLESPLNRQNLINKILYELSKNNYKGVNIDFELLFASSRDHFSIFMKELYSALKPQGFSVTVDVPAKTRDISSDTWIWAYNYAEIAQYADKVVIMTYDEHYPGGQPGPVASIGWVEKVVDYALTVIPREKIILGIAAYGYDWSSKGTKGYGINTLNNMAASYGKSVLWDEVSKSPHFEYRDSSGIDHVVWFENHQSVEYKLDIVNNKKLGGIAIWKLGLENSDYWTSIRNKLQLK